MTEAPFCAIVGGSLKNGSLLLGVDSVHAYLLGILYLFRRRRRIDDTILAALW